MGRLVESSIRHPMIIQKVQITHALSGPRKCLFEASECPFRFRTIASSRPYKRYPVLSRRRVMCVVTSTTLIKQQGLSYQRVLFLDSPLSFTTEHRKTGQSSRIWK